MLESTCLPVPVERVRGLRELQACFEFHYLGVLSNKQPARDSGKQEWQQNCARDLEGEQRQKTTAQYQQG